MAIPRHVQRRCARRKLGSVQKEAAVCQGSSTEPTARGHHLLDIRHKKEHIKHDRLQDGESNTKKIEGFVWNLGARHRDIAEAMKMY